MTMDEARLMANVNARAQRLFEHGYRARWISGPVRDAALLYVPVVDSALLEIRNSKGDAYRLDTRAGTCECPFFQGHAGRHPCKHLLGWERLLHVQRCCRTLVTRALLRAWADLDDAASWDAEVRKPVQEPDIDMKPASETEAAHACP